MSYPSQEAPSQLAQSALSERESREHGSGRHRKGGEGEEDVFSIPSKPSTVESLRRWRKATLALNATRRFRYTAPVDQEAERAKAIKRFMTGAYAVRAVHRFRQAAGDLEHKSLEDGLPTKGFGVGPGTLVRLIQNQRLEHIQRLGGANGVVNLLHSDAQKGIEDDYEGIQRRKDAFGTNTYPKKSHKTFFVFLWEAFQDTTLMILMLCAALSLAFGIKSEGPKEGWYDGASIGFAIFLVVSVTALSDYRQSLQFIILNEEKKNIHLDVVRRGRRTKISIYEVVVGDIIPLKIGDQIPADGLLVHGHSLSVDESSMTGESEHVHVDEKRPFLLSGCKVADGFGHMVVISVGLNTEWGQLMATISDDVGEETPLQVRLNGVATFIGQIGLFVAFLVLSILFIFYFTGHTSGSHGKFKAGQTKASHVADSMVSIFSIAVTIVVVAVPEGLPLAVTLTLAYSMKKMMADKALVRRLSACETMGSATTICSDKTGTLTLNMMTVVKAWVAGDIREPVDDMNKLSMDVISLLHEGIAQNSSGSIFIPKQGGETEVTGSPTEMALLSWGLKMGMDFDDTRCKSSILQVETFNSEKKRAGVALRVADSGKLLLHWKGAAEMILDMCVGLLDVRGSSLQMTDAMRAELNAVIEGMAAASFRCVAFAYRELKAEEVPSGEQLKTWKVPESDLTLMSVVGIKDPCRPEVRDAVGLCQAAGVRVRMVTGDNIVTARAIASECGILQEGDYVVEGAVFRNYSIEERRRNVVKISVMARSSPSDKLLLVKTLKELGNVVAVTGDGTNDAPALHEADIGLSMGIQGTEVAKESSDIIILDDNFSSVVKVVRWGRSVYFNIQKFIQFQLTVNVAALAINFFAAVTSGDVPLTAVQLLWVNLIMDTLGALALATEPPTDDLMEKPPVGRTAPIITNAMWRNILGQAFYQITVLLTLQFRGKDILNLTGPNADAINKTIIFNAFVLCQIFNEFNARKPENFNIFEGILQNHLFLGIIATTLILQVLIIEFLKKFASTRRLNWQHWLICIGIGFISWPLGFLLKLIPVPKKRIATAKLKLWRWKCNRREPEINHDDLQASPVRMNSA